MNVYHTIYRDPAFEQECHELEEAGLNPMLCATYRAHVAVSTLWHEMLKAMPGLTVVEPE